MFIHYDFTLIDFGSVMTDAQNRQYVGLCGDSKVKINRHDAGTIRGINQG